MRGAGALGSGSTVARLPAVTITRREGVVAGVAAVAIVACYWLLALSRGAIGALRNDDWVYARALYRLVDTGVFAPEFSMASLLGQLVLAAPVAAVFGHSMVALQALTALVSAWGLLASYLLVRTFLQRLVAIVVVGALAVGPLYSALAISFMSDPYMYALSVTCLLLGQRAVAHSRTGYVWLAASLAVGFWAFSVREFGLAAPAVVVAVYAYQRLRRRSYGQLGIALAAGLVVLVAAVAFLLWRRALPGTMVQGVGVAWPTSYAVTMLTRSAVTLGLFLAPVAALASPHRALAVLKRLWWVPALVVVALTGLAWFTTTTFKPLPNYVTTTFPYGETVAGTAPSVTPTRLYQAQELLGLAVALVAVAILVTAIVTIRARRQDQAPETPTSAGFQLTAAFAVAYTVGLLAVQGYTGALLFDRYFLPSIVPAAATIAYCAVRTGLVTATMRRIAVVGLVLFGLLGLWTTDLANLDDGVKNWMAATWTAKGYAPSTIDAGYEWFGYYNPNPFGLRKTAPEEPWYWGLFPPTTTCVRISYDDGSTLTTERVVDRITVKTLIGREVAYRVTVPTVTPAGCPRS